jgi:hypothetical protein
MAIEVRLEGNEGLWSELGVTEEVGAVIFVLLLTRSHAGIIMQAVRITTRTCETVNKKDMARDETTEGRNKTRSRAGKQKNHTKGHSHGRCCLQQ